MNEQLIQLYNRELMYLYDFITEYAEDHPEAAAHLGVENGKTNDPYVNMLLDGFAYLAARVQLQLEAEFPRFTEQLFHKIYPHYVAPIPSMTIVEFDPLEDEGSLATGFTLPSRTRLRYQTEFSDVPCTFETAHPVTLWPITVEEASYFLPPGPLTTEEHRSLPNVRAGLRVKLRTFGDLDFNTLPIQNLTFYLQGSGDIAFHLYEQLLGNLVTVIAGPTRERIPKEAVQGVGFDDSEALLPTDARLFRAYRLLREYFAFPQRFLFVDIGKCRGGNGAGPGRGLQSGLDDAVRNCVKRELEIVFLFNRRDAAIENTITSTNVRLFCTPAVNLFHQQADHIQLEATKTEYKVRPNRLHPIAYEVHDVTRVAGLGGSTRLEQPFHPFYAAFHSPVVNERDRKHYGDAFPPTSRGSAYYVVHRRPREKSEEEKQRQAYESVGYLGSEVYLSLVDSRGGPLLPKDLRQLEVHTRCTNRYLTWRIVRQAVPVKFELSAHAPVKGGVTCIEALTEPQAAPPHGENAWRLLSHLALNFALLAPILPESASGSDAEGRRLGEPHALRELLSLYCNEGSADLQHQIEAIHSIYSQVVTEQLPGTAHELGRGLLVTLTFDESVLSGANLSGARVFLMGAVLEKFFSRYASINSFTQTVVRTLNRGEIKEWPVRLGMVSPM